MTKEQQNELEELGELQFSLTECATIMQIDEEKLEASIVHYERGRLRASAAVRKAILKQATQGSTPAQKQMLDLIEKAKRTKKSSAEPKELADIQKILKGLNSVSSFGY